MHKLTVIAATLLVATSAAQAAEVFKNEQVTVDAYGRIYAGQFMGTKKDSAATSTNDYSAKVGANQFIRFGVKADSAISGTPKAVGQYEAQFNIGDSEKINNVSCTTTSPSAGTYSTTCKDDKVRTRLAFAGVKSDNWGQITFGRQKGAISQIADWTDVSLSDGYGADALGRNADTYGTGRSSNVLKYSGKFGGTQLEANYKFDGNGTEHKDDAAANAAYGVSASYTLPMGLSAGLGYNVGVRNVSGANDAKLLVAGVKFDNKSAYAALNYGKGTDFLAVGTDHTAWEVATGYNFVNGFGVLAMYNKQKSDTAGVKTDTVDYYTLGAQYQFNKAARVIAEYRIQNLDNNAAKAEAIKDDYQLAARYDF